MHVYLYQTRQTDSHSISNFCILNSSRCITPKYFTGFKTEIKAFSSHANGVLSKKKRRLISKLLFHQIPIVVIKGKLFLILFLKMRISAFWVFHKSLICSLHIFCSFFFFLGGGICKATHMQYMPNKCLYKFLFLICMFKYVCVYVCVCEN